MDDEHQYRVRAFDALAENDVAAEIARVLAGSDPPLLRAMIDACGADERLRDFGRGLRKETLERLAAALARVRQARGLRGPALDANTAAWATLRMGDVAIDVGASGYERNVIDVLAFATGRDVERVPA